MPPKPSTSKIAGQNKLAIKIRSIVGENRKPAGGRLGVESVWEGRDVGEGSEPSVVERCGGGEAATASVGMVWDMVGRSCSRSDRGVTGVVGLRSLAKKVLAKKGPDPFFHSGMRIQ